MSQSKIQIISKDDIGELKDEEIQLIYLIRNRFKWGDIIIQVRGGTPYRVLKAFESSDL